MRRRRRRRARQATVRRAIWICRRSARRCGARNGRFCGPTILVALITLIVVQVITPRYQSESRVFIEGRDNVYLRPDVDRNTAERTVDQEAVTSQAQIILSRDLAREVINKLKLGERPEFDPALNGVSPIKAVLGLFGLVKDPLSMTPEERVLQAYYDDLTGDSGREIAHHQYRFSFAQDPELAAQVANAIADGYLMRQREAKQDQAKSAGQWLSGEIETMRKKVEDAEAKVEDFRAKANLLVGNNNTTLSAQQLGDVNAQLAAARAQKVDAEAKAKLIRDMLRSGQPIESSDILNSELHPPARRAARDVARATRRAIVDAARQPSAHQGIEGADRRPRQSDQSRGGHHRALVRKRRQARQRAPGFADGNPRSAQEPGGDRPTGRTCNCARSNATPSRSAICLESYLAKYREATSRDTINSTPADARVISRATVSNVPAYPKKLPTMLIAVFRDVDAQLRSDHDQGNSGRSGRFCPVARRAEPCAATDVQRPDGGDRRTSRVPRAAVDVSEQLHRQTSPTICVTPGPLPGGSPCSAPCRE